MNSKEGKILVDGGALQKEMTYERLSSIEDYEGSRCIIVNTMDPDLFLVFGKIDVIISKQGSKLSHLAILAREYGKTLILADCTDENIAKKGDLKIIKEDEKARIEFS
ncbi:MAG: PEP-utilizing enzyme [Candidatus Woesearchaeota archaeon]